jgi:oligopeptidase B
MPIAHIRGGKDKGYAWYEGGKREHKPNTFSDFIAAADTSRRTSHSRGKDRGGGRLGRRHADGRVANMAPELFAGISRRGAVRRRAQHDARRNAAAHPAGMAGMGQPARLAEAYRTILGYSPYDNVPPSRIRPSSFLPGSPIRA